MTKATDNLMQAGTAYADARRAFDRAVEAGSEPLIEAASAALRTALSNLTRTAMVSDRASAAVKAELEKETA